MLKIPFRVSTRDYQGKRVNPHIGPLLKAIPFKLFLDIVPSFSQDVTRAMRGQAKRFSRNYMRRNVLVSFHTKDVFCTLSHLFVEPGFRLFFCLFGCSLFYRLFGFWEFN